MNAPSCLVAINSLDSCCCPGWVFHTMHRPEYNAVGHFAYILLCCKFTYTHAHLLTSLINQASLILSPVYTLLWSSSLRNELPGICKTYRLCTRTYYIIWWCRIFPRTMTHMQHNRKATGNPEICHSVYVYDERCLFSFLVFCERHRRPVPKRLIETHIVFMQNNIFCKWRMEWPKCNGAFRHPYLSVQEYLISYLVARLEWFAGFGLSFVIIA